MNISRVIIDNFRNIKHAEYDLKKMNIFAGPNGTGKSNTLLAIYWVLNDYLLDGSSDNESNKPFVRDRSTKTSVYLEFDDGWNIKREYFEKWVKKQGTDEVKMEGHENIYYILGDKEDVKFARKELAKKLGLNTVDVGKKFNFSLAMTDPYYLGASADQTDLRAFIIELVGDVSNDDVFALDKKYENIREELEMFNGDPSKAIKSIKKKISLFNQEIDGNEKAVAVLKETEDVSAEELKTSISKCDEIEKEIATYRVHQATFVNKNVETLEKKKADLQLKLAEQVQSDQQILTEMNSELNEKIDKKRSEYMQKKKELESLNSERFQYDHQKRILERTKMEIERTILDLESQLDNCREEYARIYDSVFNDYISLPSESKCPNCGHLLNSGALDEIKRLNKQNELHFKDDKERKLSDNVKRGKECGLKLAHKKAELDETNCAISKIKLEGFDELIKKTNDEAMVIEREGKELASQLQKNYVSKETAQLRDELALVESHLSEEKNSDHTQQDIEDKILACMERKNKYSEIISKHELYVQTSKEIERIEENIKRHSQNQTKYEQKLALVSEFMKTKLSMLTKNVESVFGTRITFTLVKTNIKEGSWKEVCYPSVLDKETPFTRGSESEQIRTGVYMIECIKKKLGLKDVPIIFDRSNDLDSYNLSNIGTSAQIITTRVDDINHKDVTLVHG